MSTELVERLRAGVPLTEVDGREVADTDAADATMEAAADELTALTAKLERESGDLRYAKQALDRETARALKFGKRITALTAKVALLTEALKPFSHAAGGVFTRNFNASDVLFLKGATASHAESKITAGDLFAALRALSEPDKEGML